MLISHNLMSFCVRPIERYVARQALQEFICQEGRDDFLRLTEEPSNQLGEGSAVHVVSLSAFKRPARRPSGARL